MPNFFVLGDMGLSLPASVEQIQNLIHVVRGRRVILDADLAALYGVPTHHFNQAIKRNAGRFPGDFRFRLSPPELAAVRSVAVHDSEVSVKSIVKGNSSQIVMSSGPHRGAAYLPWAFTEHGALMAAKAHEESGFLTTDFTDAGGRADSVSPPGSDRSSRPTWQVGPTPEPVSV